VTHDRTVRAAIAVGALALLAAAFASGQTAPGSPPPRAEAATLSGTWKLNTEQSENFRDKMRQARGDGGEGRRGGGRRGGGGGGGGGFGKGGGGRGGGMPGQAGSGEPDVARESMRRLAEPAEVLTIKTEGEAILVADDTGTIRRLRPDGRTMKTDNGEGQVRARWERGALVAETVPARGPSYRETFALSPDRQQLFVTVHLQPPTGGAVDVRRVYDAAP
jgi:hypothetical protein